MANTNIYIAGVGGQGLVLSTGIISEVAFLEGYDIRTNDVIGLSQRGGRVYGSIRFGEKIFSPQIPEGEGDILLALEKLEGLRYAPQMKKGAYVIMSDEIIFPNRVLIEKDEYPDNINDKISQMGLQVISVEAKLLALKSGNIKTTNIVLLGALSTILPFARESWISIISKKVPLKTLEANLNAFTLGCNIK